MSRFSASRGLLAHPLAGKRRCDHRAFALPRAHRSVNVWLVYSCEVHFFKIRAMMVDGLWSDVHASVVANTLSMETEP
jgi:hypothetical protein